LLLLLLGPFEGFVTFLLYQYARHGLVDGRKNKENNFQEYIDIFNEMLFIIFSVL